jgi:hypothetical protein
MQGYVACGSENSATNSNDGSISSFSDSKVKAISSFLSLCEKATINIENEGLSNAVRAVVILCMKFVDKEALFKAVLPDTFVDWTYVKVQSSSTTSLRKNMLGDASTWLHLMQFVDFGDPAVSTRVMQAQYPPLYCLHSAISNLRCKLSFSDACKILIFNNVEGLSSRTMIELHASARLNHNAYTICTSIVNALADERHGADVYESAFKYVIGTAMKVDEKLLAQHIAHFKQTSAARVKAWEMKAIQSKICRPSMRKVAQMMASHAGGGPRMGQSMAGTVGSGGASMAGGASASSMFRGSVLAGAGPGSVMMGVGGDPCGGGAADETASTSFYAPSAVGNAIYHADGSGVSSITFEAHSFMVRYPNSMSNLRRLRCYLLACQGHHFSYQEFLPQLVSSDVAKALAENPVAIPDVNSLYTAIDSLAMNIRPFEQLNQFRTRCFVSFASHQKRNLTLTQVLKLYVAAYQFKPIWKQLWTTIYPVISPQIIRDVESFVATVPFAVEPFVQILKTSSPFSVT